MSTVASAWVWKHAPHKGGTLLVLLAIADHADQQGEHSYCGVSTLGREARLSPRQVQYVLRELETAGTIVETGTTKRGTHIYAIPAVGGKAVDKPVDKGGADIAPGATDFTGGVQPTSPEPYLSRPSETTRKQEVTVVGDRPPWAAAAIEEPQADELGGIRPTEMQLYLRGKIAQRYPESDGDLTETAVARLNAIFTPGVVLEAMQSMDGFPPSRLETIYGYLFAICQRRARESAHV